MTATVARLARLTIGVAVVASVAAPAPAVALDAPPPTPRAVCGPGAKPEPDIQGRVPAGVPDEGYRCNTDLVGHEGNSGGFKVERFADNAGHQCAYYDTTLLYPTQAIQQLRDEATGVAVVDMTNPADPMRTETLASPAMQSPHESVLLNEKRGLLIAVMGNPLFYPGVVDVYDVNADCRHPELLASAPVGLLGHESGFAPDGNTFYATSLTTGHITAVDVTDPKLPTPLGVYEYPSHGFGVSADGNRGYAASMGIGLQVLDTSQIQAREPDPQMPEISRLDWPTRTVPQANFPIAIDGKPYLLEVDEFSSEEDGNYNPSGIGPRVGAARIIDISDERAPKVVSDIRLAVNNPENRDEVSGDPGASSNLQGYASHYCGVPTTVDPPIVACSFIASGLRVFDIRDPYNPKEVAYFVAPPAPSPVTEERSNYAMSKPAFDIARKQIWYSDGNSGLYAVQVTNDAWPSDRTKPNNCTRRKSVALRLSRRFKSAQVKVNGKRVKVRRRGGRLRVRVKLGKAPSGSVVKVRIVGKTRAGKRVVRVKRYRVC